MSDSYSFYIVQGLKWNTRRDEDTVTATYPSDQHAEREPGWATGKTNTVCTRIREILARKDLLAYINTILTTHLCESPPDPEAALQTLASFRSESLDLACCDQLR